MRHLILRVNRTAVYPIRIDEIGYAENGASKLVWLDHQHRPGLCICPLLQVILPLMQFLHHPLEFFSYMLQELVRIHIQQALFAALS